MDEMVYASCVRLLKKPVYWTHARVDRIGGARPRERGVRREVHERMVSL
jgi:hypothetical protein